MLAFDTLDTDVSSQPHHLPLVAAAGVFLSKANDVTQPDFHNHVFRLGERE